MTATVSVIVPCYNASRWIRETLESAFSRQSVSLEVIVVDDGSSDGSAGIVEREFPDVKLIRTSNQGASQARNTGTEAASGDFIQYLDADDLLAPGKIASQLSLLEATGADIAYGDWQRLIPNDRGEFARGQIVARQMRNEPELELFGTFWCPPAVYLFRRQIVHAVGKWNEKLPVIQDARFALDCALRGARFEYTPGIVAYYRDHPSGSLKNRDPLAFVKDVHLNAIEVQDWWAQHGGITDLRKALLIQTLSYVTRASFEQDRSFFEVAYADLERLSPGFIPAQPRRLAVLSRLIGYRHAEAWAWSFRRLKKSMKRVLQTEQSLASGAR